MRVRSREAADLNAVERFLAGRGSLRVARLGRLEATLDHPALVAEWEGGEAMGRHGDRAGRGAGGPRGGQGWGRLWLLTTNDNVDALRFYQRRGFRLTGLHAGAVDRARTQLKPEIPPEGQHGIPLRDELVLEKAL